jgi:hypothetical protein
MTKQAIRTFLSTYGTRVTETPDNDAELWMDDHVCIRWHGVEYYVPECNSFYSIEDERILEHLENKFHV